MPEILIDKETAVALTLWAEPRGIKHNGVFDFVGPGIVAVTLTGFQHLAFTKAKKPGETVDQTILRILKETNHSRMFG